MLRDSEEQAARSGLSVAVNSRVSLYEASVVFLLAGSCAKKSDEIPTTPVAVTPRVSRLPLVRGRFRECAYRSIDFIDRTKCPSPLPNVIDPSKPIQ